MGTHEGQTVTVEGGTYGCVVVFAAFCIQMVAFGTSQAIGIYNIEFLRYFDEGAAAVSLVGSINFGMFLGASPLASVLMARWSHRKVALVGSALTNIGLLCMPFAPNLLTMYVCYGVLTGLGNCLVNMCAHVLTGTYFCQHRSLATGIASAGSGMGSIVLPLVMYVVIEHYGWQGSLFIIAGLNLHLFIFAALLFPVPEKTQRALEEQERLKEIEESLQHNSGDEPAYDSTDASTKGGIEADSNIRVRTRGFDSITVTNVIESGESPGHYGAISGPINQALTNNVGQLVWVTDGSQSVGTNAAIVDGIHMAIGDKDSENGSNNGDIKQSSKKAATRPDFGTQLSSDSDQVFYVEGTTKSKPIFTRSITQSSTKRRTSGASSQPSVVELSEGLLSLEQTVYESNGGEINNISNGVPTFVNQSDGASSVSTRDKLRKHINSVCVTDFVIYMIANIFWSSGFSTYLQFVPEYTLSMGLGKDKASVALILLGIGNTIGCVLGGLLGNIKYINRMTLYIFAKFGAGAAAFLTVPEMTHSLLGLLIICVVYGLFIGIIQGLLVVVTSDLLGIDALGAGFGYLMLANGVGLFGGPPIAGSLIDAYGGVDLAMYMVGIVSVLGGLTMCIVPIRRTCLNMSESYLVSIEPEQQETENKIRNWNGWSRKRALNNFYFKSSQE